MADRRTLLTGIVAGFSAVALAGFSVPFLRSWFPGFSSEVILDIDVSNLEPGDIRMVRWLGRNVMVIRRDREQVERLLASDQQLADPESKLSRQPDFASNEFRSRKPEHLLVYSNCTHLGCEVEWVRGEQLPFRCPCHRSEFDLAGRVEKGAAARLNLEVPDYDYVGRQVIRLRKS